MIRARGVLAAGLAIALGVAGPARAQIMDDEPSAGTPAVTADRGDAKPAARAERTRRAEIVPYIEVNQTAILSSGRGMDDVLTFTSVAAGLNTRIETRVLTANADLRYERQYALTGDLADQNMFTGLANARITLIRDMLSLEGGLVSARTRAGGYEGIPGATAGPGYASDVYSAYVGPHIDRTIGALSVTGGYRFGFNKVDVRSPGLGMPDAPAGNFDKSRLHHATLSAGMRPGVVAPFGWTLEGAFSHERANQLDQRFTDKLVRLNLTQPIAPTVALVGSLGYQSTLISNRNALIGADGIPVRDDRGRFVTDRESPRFLAYDQSGIIWDAGVLWRPSERTSIEGRAGRRYDSWSYTGSFSWRPGRNTAITMRLFDSVDSFGRAMNGSLANLPDDFVIDRNPFSGDIAGCAFSVRSGGTCFIDTLSGMAAANYRSRGIHAQLARMSGPWSVNAAAGYARRKFLTDRGSVLAAAGGVTDEILFATLNVARALGNHAALDVNLYANHVDPGFVDSAQLTNFGAYAGIQYYIGRRMTLNTALGIDRSSQTGLDNVLNVLGQLGLRYQF